MQQLEFLLEPRRLTLLAQFCQLCTASLLNMEHILKSCKIIYKALNGLARQYLSELISHCSPSRPLWFQNSGHLIIPRMSKLTAGGQMFS